MVMPVGPLGVTVTRSNGFEITGSTAQGQSIAAYAALQTTASTTPGLYTINLSTGAATLVGPIGVPAGSSIVGLTAPPSTTAPASNTSIFAVLTNSNGTQSLAQFNFGTPGTLTANNTIAGLGAGETIIGADYRPSNGVLYALTRNAIYTLAANGQATQVATLTGTTLNGANFGVDVSPPADAIRVLSDTGQNVAVTFAGAVLSTESNIAPLNMPAQSIFALGYTSNYAMAPSTRAISIDSATSSVFVVNPTAQGTLVPLGGYNPNLTFTALGESDIVGGDDGLSLAALQVTNATQSTLYRVNPFNGQITSLGSIGPSGTPLVQALAIRLQ
jgi:hypothetical protein